MSQIESPHIGMVVEGTGDRNSVPLLLRQYLQSKSLYNDILGKPVSLKGKGSATKSGGIEGYAAAATSRPGCRGLLIVLDGDDDLSCQLGPELVDRVSRVTSVPCVVAVAERDYEDWLYSSAETLNIGNIKYSSSSRGINEIRIALGAEKYRKPVWQPRLTSRIDFNLARSRSVSFNRLLSRFDELCARLNSV